MQELESLNGTWKLVYTANSELVPLLALDKLPLVSVGDVIQRIDSSSLEVENRARLLLIESLSFLSLISPSHTLLDNTCMPMKVFHRHLVVI